MKKCVIAACVALLALFFAGCAQKTKEVTEAVSQPPANSVKPVRVSTENTDAAEPAMASGKDGAVFVAWVEHRQNKEADVMLAELDKEGQMKTATPVRVNPQAGAATAWRGDPPTVAIAADGSIHVGWTARVAAEGSANDLYLSTSRDGGKTFEQPVKVNDDGKKVTHAMHSLAVGADNHVYVVWLDERNVVKPSDGKGMKMEHMEANREVFFATSADGGRTFSKNLRVGQEACPCCKTAVISGKDGRVFASWRQVLPGEFRHIALAASPDGGKTFSQPVIVSDDRWMTASCPVSGPALATNTDGTLQVVWYTEGDKGEPGLYWAESRDEGKTFSESKTLAKGQARGNPWLLDTRKTGPKVIWESYEGKASRVMSVPLSGAKDEASATSVAQSGELPSATVNGYYLFVSYISKINDRRSIWIVRADPII